jgi:hypothetical protein
MKKTLVCALSCTILNADGRGSVPKQEPLLRAGGLG